MKNRNDRFNNNRGAGGFQRRTDDNGTNNEVREMLVKLGNSLDSLSKRLDWIEGRGPDHNRGRSNWNREQQTGPRLTEPIMRSSNRDFGEVSKVLYKMVQLRHHEGNWSTLPKSIDRRLQQLEADIKPPQPDDEFRSAMKEATTEYGERICTLVRGHIRKQQAVAKDEASHLNPEDLDLAQQVASKYLTNRLGKRFDESRKLVMLQDAGKFVGTRGLRPPVDEDGFTTVVARKATPTRTSPIEMTEGSTRKRPRSSESPNPVILSNRFESLQQDDVPAGEDEVEQVSRQPLGKRRYASVQQDAGHKESVSLTQSVNNVITGRPETTEQEPHGLQPSGNRIQSARGVYIYSGPKEHWKIKPATTTQVVVLGDSNLRLVKKIPEKWEVHCYPGAKFYHITSLVKSINKSDALKHVIVQAGINHRSQFSEDYMGQLDEMVKALNDMDVKVSATGVSMSKNYRPEIEYANIIDLNLDLKFRFDYIEALPEVDIVTAPGDKYGTHHTQATVDKVIGSMVTHHSNLCLN